MNIDSIGKIDDDLIESVDALRQNQKKRSTKKNTWVKWGAMVACLCLLVIGFVTIMPTVTPEFGAGKKPIPGGTNEGINYSVAVFPAERKTDEVKDAYAEAIAEVEAKNEQGLGDYLPSELPNGYHFGKASIYVTTMNDGTVYKMLRVTYRTGEEPEVVTDADGAVLVPGRNELGDEFMISIWSFMPDTSVNIYQPGELNEAVLSENDNGSLFYVQFKNVYIGIEPLSLSIDDVVKLADSVLK